MCGIVGVAGFLGKKEEDAFHDLLIVDSVRGLDSSGIASISRFGDPIVVKEVGDPFYVLNSKEYDVIRKRNNSILLGHNRFATVGGITKKSAHPFVLNSLIGVHNGTLKNKWELLNHKDFAVDSENLYYQIQQEGVKKAIDAADGAWSLVWWDSITNELNFLRNKERPMFIAASKDQKTIFWASESWMLIGILARNGIALQEAPIEPTEVDMLYTFGFDQHGTLQKPLCKKMESAYKPKWQAQNWKVPNFIPGFKPQKTKLNLVSTNSVAPIIAESVITEYVKRKGVTFEIKSLHTDSHGATYLRLVDPHRPGLPVRTYIPYNSKMTTSVGKFCRADVKAWVNTKKDGSFFKVTASDLVLPATEEEDGVLYYGGKNQPLMTKEQWEKKFPNCAWCFAVLSAETVGNRLTTLGQCLCPDCVDNRDARECVTLI